MKMATSTYYLATGRYINGHRIVFFWEGRQKKGHSALNNRARVLALYGAKSDA